MRYASAGAFRDALEARINERARQGQSVSRLRKQIVFERLLFRLQEMAPDGWLLKGGFALELRLGDRARATKDIDVDWELEEEQATSVLLDAAQLDIGDHFVFAFERVALVENVEGRGQQWRVTVHLAGRVFEQVLIDVGFAVKPLLAPERLDAPPLLDFAELEAASVPAAALEQHLAEKLHAYTRRYAGNQPSFRVKDLVDILLIAGTARFQASRLRAALADIFEIRATHPCPPSLPPPPVSWAKPFASMAERVELSPEFDRAYADAAAFFDPVLKGGPDAYWDPELTRWSQQGATDVSGS